MTKVFIDGSSGTTGLRIRQRLEQQKDLELLKLPEELRKDAGARQEIMAQADVIFLCLPDAAAREAVTLAGDNAAVIDTSTAHRVAEGWTYGFAEIGLREKIAASRRIANPGCHASGFLALAAPLVQEGLISPDAALCCFSLTGYSGGGKSMIAQYEDPARPAALDSPRQYGLEQSHKHLPEMQKLAGLTSAPVFCPIVADYYSGMEVTVPLFAKDLRGSAADVVHLYRARYAGPVVHYEDCPESMLAANALSGRDDMVVTVTGSGERLLLTALFDNLGKGASGAAIQNMNLLLGRDETEGLVLGKEGTEA